MGMLNMIVCLKRTDMPIKEIKQFCQWVQQGDASLQQRFDLFQERRKAVQEQMEQLKRTREVIGYKCWYYETALAAGTEAIHQKGCGNE